MSTIPPNYTIELTGTITIVQPLSITRAEADNGIPTMPIIIDGQPVRIVVIPATSLRGRLRRVSLQVINDAITGGKELAFNLAAYQWNANGGTKTKKDKDAKSTDILRAHWIRQNNPLIAIWGAGTIFITGKLLVSEARQSLETLLSYRDLVYIRKANRKDDLRTDPELLAQLSEEDVDTYLLGSQAQKQASALRKTIASLVQEGRALRSARNPENEPLIKENREALAAHEKQLEELTTGKDYAGVRNLPHEKHLIAAGVTFDHTFRLHAPTPIEFGLFLETLRRFSRNPRIGGLINHGFGQIEANYTIRIWDGIEEDENRNPLYRNAGTLNIAENDFSYDGNNPAVLEASAAWAAAAENKLAEFDFSAPNDHTEDGETEAANDADEQAPTEQSAAKRKVRTKK